MNQPKNMPKYPVFLNPLKSNNELSAFARILIPVSLVDVLTFPLLFMYQNRRDPSQTAWSRI